MTTWDSFEQEIDRTSRPAHYGCRICKLLESVEPEDRKIIESVLADPVKSSRGIARAMKTRGVRTTPETVTRHRKGECSL